MTLPMLNADSAWWPELSASPAGRSARMLMTTRQALGPSHAALGQPPYQAFNLGDHVGDDPLVVQAHRDQVAAAAGAHPVWLSQVHGHRVVQLSWSLDRQVLVDGQPAGPLAPAADGSWTTEPGLLCTVMVADCLPVLLAAPDGRGVAALHAGWRGLCGAGQPMNGRGVIEQGVAALCQGTACEPADLMAWLGPCIGPDAFEVGPDVLYGFGLDPSSSHPALRPRVVAPGAAPKWWANLPLLARLRLQGLGVQQVAGGRWCTVSEPSRFFSFRRDGVTGRQAAGIWLAP